MIIIFTVAIAIMAALISLVVKDKNPEFSMLISLSAGAVIIFMIIAQMVPIINEIKNLVEISSIDSENISLLLKALGICLITQFCADSCLDAGQKAMASKVELAGKVTIVFMSLPLFRQILEIIVSLGSST